MNHGFAILFMVHIVFVLRLLVIKTLERDVETYLLFTSLNL
jgi:hypothetical protein